MKKRGGLFKLLLFIVIIGAGVFCAITFWPKNTTKVFEAVYAQMDGGMLDNSKEEDSFYSVYTNYYNTLRTTGSFDDKYLTELENFNDSYESLLLLADFYGHNISFSNVNKTFKKNSKTVTKNFKKANKVADDMYNYMVDSLEKGVQQSTWANYSWANYRESFRDVLKYYNNAYTALATIYKACVPESAVSHNLTYLVLDAGNSYLKLTIENFDKQNEYAGQMHQFLNTYLNTTVVGGTSNFNRSILQYQFNSDLKKQATLVYEASDKGLQPNIDYTDAYNLYQTFLQGGFRI